MKCVEEDVDDNQVRAAAPVTNVIIMPLRKKRLSGEFYARDPKVETLLVQLSALSREELIARATITTRSESRLHPKRVPRLLHQGEPAR